MRNLAKSNKSPSYDDILALPEGITGEVLDGELHTSPRPHPIHQHAMLKVSTPLDRHYGQDGGEKGGWFFLTEPQLHLEGHHIVPDISGWRIEKLPDKPGKIFINPVITVTPQWICEILSPTSGKRDRILKKRVYLELKIDYYWIIDPVNRTIEVFKYENPSKWAEIGGFGGEEKVRIKPFNDVEFELSTLWLI